MMLKIATLAMAYVGLCAGQYSVYSQQCESVYPSCTEGDMVAIRGLYELVGEQWEHFDFEEWWSTELSPECKCCTGGAPLNCEDHVESDCDATLGCMWMGAYCAPAPVEVYSFDPGENTERCLTPLVAAGACSDEADLYVSVPSAVLLPHVLPHALPP
jgi:hypothetical protein